MSLIERLKLESELKSTLLGARAEYLEIWMRESLHSIGVSSTDPTTTRPTTKVAYSYDESESSINMGLDLLIRQSVMRVWYLACRLHPLSRCHYYTSARPYH